MQIHMRHIKLYAVIFTIVISSAFGLMSASLRRMNSHRNTLVMSSGKTPLVANGKRFEADSGSSLIVVSPIHISKQTFEACPSCSYLI